MTKDDHWRRHDCLFDLYRAYLFIRAWATPHFESFDAEDRDAFRHLVKSGGLLGAVEECKREVLRSGIQIPDRWLAPLAAAGLREGMPIAPIDSKELGEILHDMWPMLVRLDLEAENERPPASADEKQGPDGRAITAREAEHLSGINRGTIKNAADAGKIDKVAGGYEVGSLVKWVRARLAKNGERDDVEPAEAKAANPVRPVTARSGKRFWICRECGYNVGQDKATFFAPDICPGPRCGAKDSFELR